MLLELKVPSPGESISEVELIHLSVSDGGYIKKGDLIAEFESDKATLEIISESSGSIKIKVAVGDILKVGSIFAIVDTSADVPNDIPQVDKRVTSSEEVVDKTTDHSAEQQPIKPYPSPAARKILAEKEIDLNQVKGSGKEGRITKGDAIEAMPFIGPKVEGTVRETFREKLSAFRRKLSERLVRVKNETAMLTTFNEVNMAPIISLRDEYKDAFLSKHGFKLGFMSFFTRAVTLALKKFPDVSAMVDGDHKVWYSFIDISIAVSTDKGLMAPVLRDVENLDIKTLEESISALVLKAREGKITLEDLSGGVFTISNGGVFGSMLSTPILNPPQSAVLGMHNIIQRPVAVDGEVKILPIMYLALSYDHRLIDGKESVGFLSLIKDYLEHPVSALMDDDPKKALHL